MIMELKQQINWLLVVSCWQSQWVSLWKFSLPKALPIASAYTKGNDDAKISDASK